MPQLPEVEHFFWRRLEHQDRVVNNNKRLGGSFLPPSPKRKGDAYEEDKVCSAKGYGEFLRTSLLTVLQSQGGHGSYRARGLPHIPAGCPSGARKAGDLYPAFLIVGGRY
jgi:hypothetical protein